VADAAIGLRAHSGWAALIALAGPRESPAVVARRRIELAGPGIPKQPYHVAENLSLPKARTLLARFERGSARLASAGFRETAKELGRSGHEAAACGLVLASGRALPGLAAVLSSHALIHTADGEHFREALRKAAARAGLPTVEVREKEIWDRAAEVLARTAQRLRREIDALGKPLGPPWTSDQKLASLVAWMALPR
jgi:hypothetical protein